MSDSSDTENDFADAKPDTPETTVSEHPDTASKKMRFQRLKKMLGKKGGPKDPDIYPMW